MSANFAKSKRLRIGIHYGNVCDLPSFSTGPRGGKLEYHRAVAQAGYEGLQCGDSKLCEQFGLKVLGGGVIKCPAEAYRIAAEWKDKGATVVTCIAGFGMESDGEMDGYAAAICEAAAEIDVALLLETHRASITQDAWRTVQLSQRFPKLRFNLDLSHWFTGQEMAYGDVNARLAFIEPVLARTLFLHGRVGNRCCMQVPLCGVREDSLAIFRGAWMQVMRSFLQSENAGTDLWFCPELLGTEYAYARQFRNRSGELCEESDRWEEAHSLAAIARECFEQVVTERCENTSQASSHIN